MSDSSNLPPATSTATVPDGDSDLLGSYVNRHDNQAFTRLVARHVGFVYHAALRQVAGNPTLAEDVTQTVFAALARKAPELADRAVLAGWLFTSTRYAAAAALRANRRRQKREQEAYAMQQSTPEDSADWTQLKPVIDDALNTLNQADREAVLLRFFEGQSFSSIGARLHLTEDTARVRVSRALDKLRVVLERRGVVSTAAGLSVALSAQAGAAAPAGLATAVATKALVGATIAGGVGIFSLMSSFKIVVGAIAVASLGVAVLQTLRVSDANQRLRLAEQSRSALATELQAMKARLAELEKRSAAEAEDNAKLLAAIARTHNAPAKPADPESLAPEQFTEAAVNQRYRHAQDLARAGNWEAALSEFLWCLDEGMVRSASFMGVRRSFLLSELGKLAKNYPPALTALQQRRDAAEKLMLTSPGNRDAAADLAAINHYLDEDTRTLASYDQLPPDDPRRRSLAAVFLYPSLVDAQRYQDAVAARPYNQMVRTFDSMVESNNRPEIQSRPDRLSSLRSNLVQQAAINVETLAGSGDLTHARELVTKILTYDSSPETFAALRTRAARSGHPEIIPSAPAP